MKGGRLNKGVSLAVGAVCVLLGSAGMFIPLLKTREKNPQRPE